MNCTAAHSSYPVKCMLTPDGARLLLAIAAAHLKPAPPHTVAQLLSAGGGSHRPACRGGWAEPLSCSVACHTGIVGPSTQMHKAFGF